MANEKTISLDNLQTFKTLEDAEIDGKLSNKQDTLVSGTNIKTINNTSILGSGNIEVESGTTVTVSGSAVTTFDADTKMNKANPTGTGSFSLNRKANTTVGNYSFAEGDRTTASGESSHAEGNLTTASKSCSHAEGYFTTASGNNSHAEGDHTTAQRKSQHAFGEYNVLDTTGSATSRGSYVEIVGNGTSSARSNARTLDWNGNEVLAGGLTIGANATINDGTNSISVANIVTKLDASMCTLQTTAPTAAITDGGVHIVYLSSEPSTKYSGYIYLISG